MLSLRLSILQEHYAPPEPGRSLGCSSYKHQAPTELSSSDTATCHYTPLHCVPAVSAFGHKFTMGHGEHKGRTEKSFTPLTTVVFQQPFLCSSRFAQSPLCLGTSSRPPENLHL